MYNITVKQIIKLKQNKKQCQNYNNIKKMGNKQISSTSILSQFNIIQTQHTYPYNIIQHKRTHNILFVKQLTISSSLSLSHPTKYFQKNNSLQQIQSILQNKLNNKCTFVTQVNYWQKIKNQDNINIRNNGLYCGEYIENIVVLFSNYGVKYPLKQFIQLRNLQNRGIIQKKKIQDFQNINRNKNNSKDKNKDQIYENYELISIQQAHIIIQSVLKGFKYYNNIRHLHNSININSILFDGQRVILLDPWLTQYNNNNNTSNLIININTNNSNQKQKQSQLLYKSPQRQLYERDQIQSFDQMKSLLYQFGLLIVDLVTNYKYSQYNKEINVQTNPNSRSNSNSKSKSKYKYKYKNQQNPSSKKLNLNAILQQIQQFKLRSHLNILLNPNPQKRQLIFNILLPQKLTLKQFNFRKPTNMNLPTQTTTTNRLITQFTQNSNKRKKSLKKQVQKRLKTQNNSLDHRNNYFSYQGSPQSRSLVKQQKQQSNQKKYTSSNQSSFSYAQMLRTPTQSNHYQSKRQSPIRQLNIQKNNNTTITNWPYPHKIINTSNNKNINKNININQDKIITERNPQITNNTQKQIHINPFVLYQNDIRTAPKNKLIAKSIARNSQSNRINLSKSKQKLHDFNNLSNHKNYLNYNNTNNTNNTINSNNNSHSHYPHSNQISIQSQPQNIENNTYNNNYHVNLSNQRTNQRSYQSEASSRIKFSNVKNLSVYSQQDNNSIRNYSNLQRINDNRSVYQNNLSLQKLNNKRDNIFQNQPIIPNTPQYYNQNQNLLPYHFMYKPQQQPIQIKPQQTLSNFSITPNNYTQSHQQRLPNLQINNNKLLKISQKESPPTPSFIQKMLTFGQSGNIRHIKSLNDEDVGYKKKTFQSVQEQQQISSSFKQYGNDVSYILVQDSGILNSNNNNNNNNNSNYNSQLKQLKTYQSSLTNIKQSNINRQQNQQQYRYSNNNYNNINQNNIRNIIKQKPSQIQAKQTQSIIFSNQSKQTDKNSNNTNKKQQYSAFVNKNNDINLIKGRSKNFQGLITNNNNNKQDNNNYQQKQINPTKITNIKKYNSQQHKNNINSLKFQPNSVKLQKLPHLPHLPHSPHSPSIYNKTCKLVTSIDRQTTQSNSSSIVDYGYIPFHLRINKNNQQQNILKHEQNNNGNNNSNNNTDNNNNKYKINNIQQQLVQSNHFMKQLRQIDKQDSNNNKNNNNNTEYNSGSFGLIPISNVDSQKFTKFQSNQTLINKLVNTNNNISQASLYNMPSQLTNKNQLNYNSNLDNQQILLHSNLQSNTNLKYYVIQNYPSNNNIKNKQRYEGYKINNKREGHGAYYYTNGCVYEGQWSNDKQNGYGCIWRKKYIQNYTQGDNVNGNIIQNRDQYEIVLKGIWQNGELVQAFENMSNYSSKTLHQSAQNKYKTSLSKMFSNQQISSPSISSSSNNYHTTSIMGSLKKNKYQSDPKFQTVIGNIPKNQVLTEQLIKNQQLKVNSNQNLKQNKITKQNNNYQNQLQDKIIQQHEESLVPIVRISDQKNNYMIKFQNGDIFKGTIQNINDSDKNNQKIFTGKVYTVIGEQILGTWIAKNNKLQQVN